MAKDVINWFELPTQDIDRAIKFYSAVLDQPMQRNDMGELPYSFLPMEQSENGQGGVGGALIQHEQYTPNASGTIVYLNCGENLQPTLDRVEKAGGKVVMPKTEIGQGYGFTAMFIDSEGNRVGLHSMG